jgi:hypothetical protein
MNSLASNSPDSLLAIAVPCPTPAWNDANAPLQGCVEGSFRQAMAGIIAEESELFAITRDWSYEAFRRRFVQLYALLEELLREIGVCMTWILACVANPEAHPPEDAIPPRKSAVTVDALQVDIARLLLRRHEDLIARLKSTNSASNTGHNDRTRRMVLADLTAERQKDAFLLRALLWEA